MPFFVLEPDDYVDDAPAFTFTNYSDAREYARALTRMPNPGCAVVLHTDDYQPHELRALTQRAFPFNA